MLHLCYNQALLSAVERSIGQGGKIMSVGAPDAKISREASEELWKRTTAEAATFLVKIQAHRGELSDEEADFQADKATWGQDVCMKWHDTKSSSLDIVSASPERRQGALWSSKVNMEQWGAKGDQTKISFSCSAALCALLHVDCCSVLQCVAVKKQWPATTITVTHCNTMQHTATHYNNRHGAKHRAQQDKRKWYWQLHYI